MRFLLILILLVVVVIAGLAVLDWFGYYIDWKISLLGVSILVPVVTAVRNLVTNPFKKLNQIRRKMEED
jgi:hypothetical protein